MTTTHIYHNQVEWLQDRQGKLSAPELHDTLEVATPPPFPKGIEGVWSPEHLFTAAVNSCFMTTFLAIAENSKLVFEAFKSEAQGKLEQVDGKFLMSEVHLSATLTIPSSVDADKAERILQKAEAACLISHSIRSKVVLTTHIKTITALPA